MAAHRNLIKAVRHVLKMKAKAGTTTKNDVAVLVLKRIEMTGGMTKYGIGQAALLMALRHLIDVEITRQFKEGLSDHITTFVFKPTCPIEVRESLLKIPAWIAIEDGADALWMHALKATSSHWMANAVIKEKKAMQTQRKASLSLELAQYLERYKFGSLRDVFV